MKPAAAGSSTGRRHAGIERRRLDDVRLDAALSLIGPAARVDHSGSSLRAHLLGTFEILRAWGAGADVCLAGLIHSIYATQYFPTAVVEPSRRRRIAKLVGARAEHLAHFFCLADRPAMRAAAVPRRNGVTTVSLYEHRTGRALRVSGEVLRALRLIDLANELEQQQRPPAPPSAWLCEIGAAFRSIGFLPTRLSADVFLIDESAERRLLRDYHAAVRASRSRARQLLARCIAAVPSCAEPRLLLAASQLSAGDAAAAYTNAQSGLANLRGWAVAWDARVPFLAWEAMGGQLIEASRYAARELPAIAAQIGRRLRRAPARVIAAP